MSDKIQIMTRDKVAEALAPIIISASRSTDIPAFYASWFIERLRQGYVVWTNPFNQKPMYVSFNHTKAIVFWSKNPKPIIPYLHELDKRGICYYFQFTLNDYEKEGFEPNVPPLEDRIATFKQLSSLIGKERVIWRFDPLMITSELSARDLLLKIWNIGNQLKDYTEKLVFSFVDVQTYLKVQNNLIKRTHYFDKNSVQYAELTEKQIIEIVEGLCKIREYWKSEGWDIILSTCAEGIDLDMYKIEHNRCIDGELMVRIFPENEQLQYYLNHGTFEIDLFASEASMPFYQSKSAKDKGQRKECGCIESKDIGMYNTCPHNCVYCYANTSPEAVKNNFLKHKLDSESIIL
ncbi:MAG: DUF1848 domain-containing protein [Bacteroidales bacterium]|jgi:DNA repair photolyase|nr:DUF1848 domain-containing protein [Bacteroidales bacterium]